MFSDVIYVDKNTLEKERYPELLLKIIAKGGNVAKLKDDWQKKMLSSVDDAFDENNPDSENVEFFTSLPQQEDASDKEIKFLSWMNTNLVYDWVYHAKTKKVKEHAKTKKVKEEEDWFGYIADLFVKAIAFTMIPFVAESKNIRIESHTKERFRQEFSEQFAKGILGKLSECCNAVIGMTNIGFRSVNKEYDFDGLTDDEIKRRVWPQITKYLNTLDGKMYSFLRGKIVGFFLADVFISVLIKENKQYELVPFICRYTIDDYNYSYYRICFFNSNNGNNYYCHRKDDRRLDAYINNIRDASEHFLSAAFNWSRENNRLFNIDYVCFPATCNVGEKISGFSIESLLKSDWKKAGLPEMPLSKLTNSSEGLFDLFWNDSNKPDDRYYYKYMLDKQYVARDPWELVKQDCQVSIDFGTSSTVVAVKDANEHVSLVRMGKYSEAVEERQYENPTVLNFVNYDSFMKAWRDLPYRPDTDFADLKFSHSARAEREEHPRSCMSSIKTWARTDNKDQILRLMDEQGYDFELKHPELSDKEDSVEEFTKKALNPVELYAYLLGCCLNNQSLGNGSIYLNYKMTFPTKFDLDTKKRIKQGFRNGLLRSLPPSLVYSDKWDNKLLRLEEYASEPVALAASFLNALDIQPTEDGVPFGVFDFGGGTTDFAMGIYRFSTDEEYEDHSWEQVLDIIDTSGDQNLGGEHLVNLMVHEAIKDNLPLILENKIRFILPPQLKEFSGSEQVWGNGLDAYENSSKLAKKLRSLWEQGVLFNDNDEQINDDQILIMLKNSFTDECPELNLIVDQNKLKTMLMDKIRAGMNRFFAMVKNAVEVTDIKLPEIHILFSGNSCRSPLTIQVLKEFQDNRDFGFSDESTKIILHTEFIDFNLLHRKEDYPENKKTAPDDDNAENESNSDENSAYISKLKNLAEKNPDLSPKTGVALGLLKIIPGESTGYVDRRISSIDNYQAPFNYYVGRIVRGKIDPTIKRNFDYVSWHLLCKVNKNHVTKIAWTADTLIDSNVSDITIKTRLIEHNPEHEGWSIFIKPNTPGSIKIAISKTGEVADLENEEIINL